MPAPKLCKLNRCLGEKLSRGVSRTTSCASVWVRNRIIIIYITFIIISYTFIIISLYIYQWSKLYRDEGDANTRPAIDIWRPGCSFHFYSLRLTLSLDHSTWILKLITSEARKYIMKIFAKYIKIGMFFNIYILMWFARIFLVYFLASHITIQDGYSK